MAGQDASCTFYTKPDITGIGIRTALYSQAFILILGPLIIENRKALQDIFRNALLSSVSLMAVTLVQVNKISFIDGLMVTFLQSILLFTVVFQVDVLIALEDQVIWRLYLLATLLRTLLEIIFWHNANPVSPLQCHNGVISKATNGKEIGRIFTIASLSLLLMVAIPFSILARLHGPRKDRNRWRIILLPIATIGIILQIIIIEVLIGANDSTRKETNAWTHGQIISLMLVTNSIFDLYFGFKSKSQEFKLFSWRGMRLDYEICKIRFRKMRKISSRISGTAPRNARLPQNQSMSLTGIPTSLSGASPLYPPPAFHTTLHIDSRERETRKDHVKATDTTHDNLNDVHLGREPSLTHKTASIPTEPEGNNMSKRPGLLGVTAQTGINANFIQERDESQEPITLESCGQGVRHFHSLLDSLIPEVPQNHEGGSLAV